MWRPRASVDNIDGPTLIPRKPKPKRQARGRTGAELNDDDTDSWYFISRRHILQIERRECRGDCGCPSDGRLTYKRDVNYDCTRINGTMSTYCFSFSKKALHSSIRQYSCYCRWCSRGRYDCCGNVEVVKHNPAQPIRPGDRGYIKWRDEGWRKVVQTIKSVSDRAVTRVLEQLQL